MGSVLCCMDKKNYGQGNLEDFGELHHDSASQNNARCLKQPVDS